MGMQQNDNRGQQPQGGAGESEMRPFCSGSYTRCSVASCGQGGW
jgi:CDGSH-type Zn-finger protein